MRRPVFGNANLTDGGTIGQRMVVPVHSQEGYKQHCYEQLRYDFAQGLLEAIERCRHPVIVEIIETETFVERDPERLVACDVLEIRANLYPTKVLNIVKYRYTEPHVEPIVTQEPKEFSWKERLRILIIGKV